VTLSAANHEMLWVPPGFAHGFYVISDEAEVLYKCTDFYSPTAERTLIWNDPDLAIDWPVSPGQDPKISHKDATGALLREAECFP
jgi:dTDP-4-dehydrorhamnose 3,5-epimerase